MTQKRKKFIKSDCDKTKDEIIKNMRRIESIGEIIEGDMHLPRSGF